MNLYVYDVEDYKVVVTIVGDDYEQALEKAAYMGFMGVDEYGISTNSSSLEFLKSSRTVYAGEDSQ